MDNIRGLWRGKRIDNGEWVKGDLVCDKYFDGSMGYFIFERDFDNSKSYTIDPSTLGECTGLTDKNGMFIFEGDIIHLWGGEHYSGYWEHDEVTVVEDITDGVCVIIGEAKYVEIIGNIHDNPDLLKGADNENI